MFYNFKLLKKGLKFLDITPGQVTKVNIVSIPKSQVEDLMDKSIITNLTKLEEEL